MILVLFGPDELAMRRRLQQLREEADGGTGMIDTNIALVEGRNAKADEILGPAMAVPFLSAKRLVVVEGFLDRFEAQGGGRPSRRGVEAFASMLDALRGGIPETTVLVFTGTKVDPKRNPMLEELRGIPGARVEQFAELNKGELLRFIREEARVQGVRFRQGRSTRMLEPGEEWQRPTETDPAQLLAELYPGDTYRISSELQKLALYTLGREATVDDVDALCGGERESKVWDFIDGVMDGDTARALTALEFLRSRGESTQGLFAQLAASLRTSATVLDLLDSGASEEEIGQAIRRPWPGLRRQAIARGRRLGRDGVRAAYEALVEADRSIKLGNVEDDLAMEILVSRLSALATHGQYRARRSAP
ncbi:MAG: hypothetical protein Kow0010_05340 [Dehalococcoidia bacterium]